MELPYSGATARSNPCTSSPFWFLLDRVTKRTGKLVRQKWTAQWRKKYQILRNCVKIQSKRQQIKEKERERQFKEREDKKREKTKFHGSELSPRLPRALSLRRVWLAGQCFHLLCFRRLSPVIDCTENGIRLRGNFGFFRRPWRFRLASSRAWGFLYTFLSTKFACNFVWSVWRGNSGFVSYRGWGK